MVLLIALLVMARANLLRNGQNIGPRSRKAWGSCGGLEFCLESMPTQPMGPLAGGRPRVGKCLPNLQYHFQIEKLSEEILMIFSVRYVFQGLGVRIRTVKNGKMSRKFHSAGAWH